MQRLIQQDPGMIAGKRPPGAVGAMLAGRQSDNQQPRIHGPKRWHRPAEVIRLFEAHGIEKRGETATAPAHRIKRAVHTGSWLQSLKRNKKRATRKLRVARRRSRAALD